jgi:2-oxoglutarate dehydrogenase E2 component (dihydrolipoamide succinyltransferase)
MTIEIKAPQFPESVAEGTIASWHKQAGQAVKQDELLVDIETDKVVLEVVAPCDGQLSKILVPAGSTVQSQQVLAHFVEAGAAVVAVTPSAEKKTSGNLTDSTFIPAGPAARKLMSEHDVSAAQIKGSGKDGRITKEDVVNQLTSRESVVQSAAVVNAAIAPIAAQARSEKRVPMTRLRARIAERLMEAKNNTAMLTTFNEVNMQPVMSLRQDHKDHFEKKHGVKLGFMSFFVQASVAALKRFPAVNASLDGQDVVYHNFYDVGVAVSSERGLVVPIIRDADQKSFAEIEQQIVQYGQQAKLGKLSLQDMTGGTFTISNGGIFGSLLSTPILNPPQTAILGMHKIQDRPMAVKGEVKILPMMYLALSYDHRLIDGKEAVQFLVTIKELLEDPARMLLDV